jgi:hypothetical protein
MSNPKNANEILIIVEFLGDEMSDDQAERLMDDCQMLSVAAREYVLASLDGGKLYTALSTHNREMGGLDRYCDGDTMNDLEFGISVYPEPTPQTWFELQQEIAKLLETQEIEKLLETDE